MRFDDRLSTILAFQATEPAAKTAVWTQIVDLLAQGSNAFPPETSKIAFDRLLEWRDQIPERRRLATSVSIAGKVRNAELIRFFASDSPSVAAPVLSRAQLTSAHWQLMLPELPPASRALLRERRDLPQETERALQSFGTSDFALTDESGGQAHIDGVLELTEPLAAQPTSIHDLVERIDSWQKRRDVGARALVNERSIADFAFETGPDGVINWVEGAPRGALIGISLAIMAEPGSCGVNGQAVGAFRKRSDMREAPLTVAGRTAVSGEWRLLADPQFDGDTGRFRGYRGIARRPDLVSNMAGSPGIPAGSIRQLVHELRTPLNAIRGFGEMIEGQFLGPVASGYRDRARTIVHDSGELLKVFEDLDANARLESDDYPMAPDAASDLVEMVRVVAALHADKVDERGVRLRIALPPREGVQVALDRASGLRMVDRLLGAALSSAQQGDLVEMAVTSNGVANELRISRVDRHDDGGIVDGFAPLGRDFALRLAGRLAEHCGGRLEQRLDSYCLILPKMQDSAVPNRELT